MIKRVVYILAVVGFALGACVPVSAAGDRNEKIQNIYFQALQTLDEENYLKGVQLYYRFVILGDIPVSKAVRAHDLAGAMGSFKKEVTEGRYSNRIELGILLVERIIERFDKAEQRLDLLREKHPSSVLLAFLRGELALARGDETLAMRIFGTMGRLPNPRGFPALADYLLEQRGRGKNMDPAARRKFFMKLAYRRWDESDFDGAGNLFRAVTKEYPQDPEAPRALIDLLLQQDKTDEAVKILDAWKGPGDEPLIPPLPLARIRYSQGQYEEALALLVPLQEADPQDAYLRLLVAESLYQLNRQAEAASHFMELARSDPKNQGFLQRLVICSEAAGRRADPLPLLEAYVRENERDSAMRFELASLLIRLDRLNEARLHFNVLREFGNPMQKEALEKIAAIDRASYERMMNNASASGNAGEVEHGEHRASQQPDDQAATEPVIGAAGDTSHAEEEQIRRMKELFK